MLEKGYTLDQLTNVLDKFDELDLEALKPLIKRGKKFTINASVDAL